MTLLPGLVVKPTTVSDTDDDQEDTPLGQRKAPGPVGAGAPFLLHLDSMAGGHKTSFVVAKLREYLNLVGRCTFN
jgi:hypothetical protein